MFKTKAHQFICAFVILSTLSGFVTGLFTSGVRAESTVPAEPTPSAPSEQAADWPMPEQLVFEPASPFLDPVDMTLAWAMGDVIDADLANDGFVRVEPLAPDAVSVPLVKLPLPSVSIPMPTEPMATDDVRLGQSDNLIALGNQDETAKDDIDLDVSEGDKLAVDSIASSVVAESTKTEKVNIGAMLKSVLSTIISAPSLAMRKAEPTPVAEYIEKEGIFRCYLPIVMKNSDDNSTPSISNQINAFPDKESILISLDGQVRLEIPQGAVPVEVIVSYRQLPDRNTEKFQTTGRSFIIDARDNAGNVVSKFKKDFVLHITYDEVTNLDESKLHLYYLDEAQKNWLPIVSTINTETNTLTAKSNSLAHFSVMAPKTILSCDFPVGEGNGVPVKVTEAFSKTYIAQGLTICPESDVHPWSGVYTQDFPDAAMIYNADFEEAFYLYGPIIRALVDQVPDGPGGWIGLPLSNVDPAGPIDEYKDEYHDFTGMPIAYFENGFIGFHDGKARAHRPFPQVSTNVIITPKRVGETYKAKVDFKFNFDLFGLSWGYAEIEAKNVLLPFFPFTFSDSGYGTNFWETSINEVGLGQTIEFSMKVHRLGTAPVIIGPPLLYSDLIGYAPCDYFTEGSIHKFTIPMITDTTTSFSFPYTCSSNIGPPSDAPPMIHYMDVWQKGDGDRTNGSIVVEAKVTDDFGLNTVELIFNGDTKTMKEKEGDSDIYEATIENAPTTGDNEYRIHAVDTSGQEAWFPRGSSLEWDASSAEHFGQVYCYSGSCGDPVNTQNGNFTYETTDIEVIGVGDTNLTIQRAYNSRAAFLGGGGGIVRFTKSTDGDVEKELIAGPPQYFGLAWTFPYAVRLVIVDNALMKGTQVFYPDGRVVNFDDNGDGTFSPNTPFNFDVLVATAEGYELRHKRTLEVEVFDAEGRFIARRDRNGNEVTLTYDGDRLSRVENASGRWLNFEYNDDGYISTIYAPEDKTLRYEYEDGNLTKYIDARGHPTLYDYDANNQLIQIITPEEHPSLRLSYDDQKRVAEQIIGEAETYYLAYSEDGSVTTQTDIYSNTTKHYYDEQGRLVQVKDALGNSEYYDYNENFNQTYLKDKNDSEWFYEYDERGNRITEDGPLDWHREWEYNNLDLVTWIQDALGRETLFEYDGRGNLITVTNALSGTSTTIYDERGLPTHVYDFNDNETFNVYDPVTGDLLKTRNGAGDEVEYMYDDLGRIHSITNGRDFVYTYAYDGNDNLIAVAGPRSYHVSYGYDKNDNRTQYIDPNGGKVAYAYNESEKLIQVTNQLTFSTSYEYNAMNFLIGLEDAENREWTYEYNEMYNRTAEHGPEDTHIFYAYDDLGRMTDATTCNSPLSSDDCVVKQITHYEYDALSRLVKIIENYKPGEDSTVDTNVTTAHTYDLVGNLLTLTDANGYTTMYQYDALDRLIYEEDAENQITEYDYDGNGNLISLTNPRDYETIYTYDGADRLATVTDALTQTWTYVYDGNGNLMNLIDPLDVVTHHEYDELDYLSSTTQNYVADAASTVDQNVTTGFDYDLAGNLRFIYDPRGTYQTEHRYDKVHRRILTIDAEEGKTEFVYDKVDNLVGRIDANDHKTTFDYNGLDRRVRVTNPETHTVQFAYDRLGNTLVITDARGYPTTFTYDGMNRPVLRVDALNGKWTYEYDAMGNLTRHIDANNHANNTYTYDKVYRLLSSTDAEDYTTSYTYDENGNRLTLTDSNVHTTTYTYDEVDHLVSITNAENETTRYQYDSLGNQTHLIAADNTVTLYYYDPLYRLSFVTENFRVGQSSNHDTNVVTRYTYDANGNLTTLKNANNAMTTFEYDGMSRLVTEIDPLGNTWRYTYDDGGNRQTRLDANGALTVYSYYPDDQLHQIVYANEMSVTYVYDRNNNCIEMFDDLGTTTWTYDALNRVMTVVDPFERTVHYTYDPVGNRIQIVYPDGNPVAYTHYRNNWLKTMVDPALHITFYQRDRAGNITRILYPNAVVTDINYDAADRVRTLVTRQTEGVHFINSAFAYTYNEVGHVEQVVNEYFWHNHPVITETYAYDGLHRLVEMVDSDGVTETYAYDSVGNRLTWATNDDLRTQRPLDGFTIAYDYNSASQLITATLDTEMPNHDEVIRYTYDANGNRINKLETQRSTPERGTDYVYDPENRLVLARDYHLAAGSNRIDHAITILAHDGNGRRLVKRYDPSLSGEGVDKRVEYVFDGLDPIVEYDMHNRQQDNYYRGALGRIATRQHFRAGAPGQFFWYHYNAKGDVASLTKQHGQSTHNYRYASYGHVIPAQGNWLEPHNHYALTDKEWDENIELYYFGARHYDPIVGVWLTQDIYRGQLDVPLSLHRYGYVHNNPVNYIDPYGYLLVSPVKVEYEETPEECNEECKKAIEEYIQLNAETIERIAEEEGVDPRIIEGAIYVEQTENKVIHSVSASVSPLGLFGIGASVEIPEDQADETWAYVGDASLGPGQVKISTVEFLQEKGYVDKVDRKTIRERLLDDEWNIRYMALYIKYHQDRWQSECPTIANQTKILGTLYNIGHYENEKEKIERTPHPMPVYTDFGYNVSQ